MGEDQVGGSAQGQAGMAVGSFSPTRHQGNSLHTKSVKESTACTHNT